MKKIVGILLAVAIIFGLTACGKSQSPAPVESTSGAESVSTADSSAPKRTGELRITIGTAGTAGALYPMGVAMAETITKHVDGISATGESTAASIENLRNLHEGKMAIGISMSEICSYAYHGVSDYEGSAYTDIRAMFSTINNYLQVFTLKDSGIKSIADLKGKTVSMGAAGSGGEMAGRLLLGVYGLDYNSIKAQFMGESDGAAALKDHKIDAMIATHPLNSAALTELTTSCDAVLLPVDNDEFYKTYPAYARCTVPAGTYPNNDKDVTIPQNSVIMCTSLNSGLTDDDVYEITKAIWENRDEWASSAKSVEKQAVWDSILKNIDIPLHPGVIRYLEEKGVTIPEGLKG